MTIPRIPRFVAEVSLIHGEVYVGLNSGNEHAKNIIPSGEVLCNFIPECGPCSGGFRYCTDECGSPYTEECGGGPPPPNGNCCPPGCKRC